MTALLGCAIQFQTNPRNALAAAGGGVAAMHARDRRRDGQTQPVVLLAVGSGSRSAKKTIEDAIQDLRRDGLTDIGNHDPRPLGRNSLDADEHYGIPPRILGGVANQV